MSTIDDTLAERGQRYGDFEGHAYLTQRIKGAMKEADGWDDLDPDMMECLEMVAHKLGRIINGDPEYVDSWTDIIGYVRLVEKRLINDYAAMQRRVDKADEAVRSAIKADDAALAADVAKVEDMGKYIDAHIREAVKTCYEAVARKVKAHMQSATEKHSASLVKEPTNADIIKASLNVAAKQQEHKLVSDALKTLEKAGIIKETRTHHDRFHVIFVGEESGEI